MYLHGVGKGEIVFSDYVRRFLRSRFVGSGGTGRDRVRMISENVAQYDREHARGCAQMRETPGFHRGQALAYHVDLYNVGAAGK